MVRRSAAEATSWITRIRPTNVGTLRVIYYHRIDDEDHRSCVSPAAFANQMSFLRNEGWQPFSLGEVAEHLDAQRAFPEKAVAVTFDDGFRDNFTTALPILEREKIPATIFLTTDYIGTRDLPVLRDRRGVPPLDWDQVRGLARAGIDLGAHTLTHPSLPDLDDDRLDREIRECRARIEEETGIRPEAFCYPRGDFDARVQEAVRRAGYSLALTTLPGCVRNDSGRYALHRTFIARDDRLRDFSHKLDGAFDHLHTLRQAWTRARLS